MIQHLLETYGYLAVLLLVGLESLGRPMDKPHRRAAVVGSAVLLVLLIGLSRMVLDVHYFSDVVGGYAAGAVWLSACVSGLEVVRRRPSAAT